MLDRNAFMETLRDVAEIVRTAPTQMTREEMLSYFKDMELTKDQEDMVVTYLTTPHEEENTEETIQEEVQTEEKSSESIPDSKVFQMYMEDIESLNTVSDDNLKMEYVKLLSGDKNSIEKISNAWLKKIVDMSNSFFSSACNPEDVIQEGNMALFIRLTELCGTKEAVDVEADLTDKVKEAMKAYISTMTGEEEVEETIAGKANLLKEAINYLKEQNGTEPTKEELAEYTHMDVEEITDIMDIMDKAKKKGTGK